jgi:hypothetical protein
LSEFLEALLSSPRKRVPLDELRRHYFSLYPDVQSTPDRGVLLLRALKELEADGAISLPATRSWEQVGSPALPLWVTLKSSPRSKASVNYADVIWTPELGFWPELRPSQLLSLQPINDFLLRRRGAFSSVPIKERSLEIFGDEKRLDNMCVGDFLFGGRLPISVIGCFRVPQPLPYRKVDAPGKFVLVVENHNTSGASPNGTRPRDDIRRSSMAEVKTSGSLGERCAKRCKKQAPLQRSTSATWTRRACQFPWTLTVPSSQAIRPFLQPSRYTAGCLRTECGVKNPSVQPM